MQTRFIGPMFTIRILFLSGERHTQDTLFPNVFILAYDGISIHPTRSVLNFLLYIISSMRVFFSTTKCNTSEIFFEDHCCQFTIREDPNWFKIPCCFLNCRGAYLFKAILNISLGPHLTFYYKKNDEMKKTALWGQSLFHDLMTSNPGET